ncbi:unnamed protein product, partial [Durusdinium trenchii]
ILKWDPIGWNWKYMDAGLWSLAVLGTYLVLLVLPFSVQYMFGELTGTPQSSNQGLQSEGVEKDKKEPGDPSEDKDSSEPEPENEDKTSGPATTAIMFSAILPGQASLPGQPDHTEDKSEVRRRHGEGHQRNQKFNLDEISKNLTQGLSSDRK